MGAMIPSSSNNNNETPPSNFHTHPATLDSRNRNAPWIRIFTVSKGRELSQGSPGKGISAKGFQTSSLAQRPWCRAGFNLSGNWAFLSTFLR